MSINKRSKKKGFTLIELIIVIAIIAILAAIAIPNFLAIQRKAKVNADIATAKELYNATAALVAEGSISLPKDSNAGVGIYLNSDGSNEKKIKDYMQTNPVPESVKDGYFAIDLGVEPSGKSRIRVVLFNKDGKFKDIYPNYSGNFI